MKTKIVEVPIGGKIPSGAKFVEWGVLCAIFEVPDDTPEAPPVVVFVKDGEPRRESESETHYFDEDGVFLYGGKWSHHVPIQHYRQLTPDETPTAKEILKICNASWSDEGNIRTIKKLRAIADAMEGKSNA